VKLHAQVRMLTTAIMRNELPPSWAALSFATAFASNLSMWLTDLEARLDYMRDWVAKGRARRRGGASGKREVSEKRQQRRGSIVNAMMNAKAAVAAAASGGPTMKEAAEVREENERDALWLGAVFFPESLYPMLCREYAMAHGIPLDTPMWVRSHFPSARGGLRVCAQEGRGESPGVREPGVVKVCGLWVHGARWDMDSGALSGFREASPDAIDDEEEVLSDELPPVMLEVISGHERHKSSQFEITSRPGTPGSPWGSRPGTPASPDMFAVMAEGDEDEDEDESDGDGDADADGDEDEDEQLYDCPVYQHLSSGASWTVEETAAGTAHEAVMTLAVPTPPHLFPEHWTLRGVSISITSIRPTSLSTAPSSPPSSSSAAAAGGQGMFGMSPTPRKVSMSVSSTSTEL